MLLLLLRWSASPSPPILDFPGARTDWRTLIKTPYYSVSVSKAEPSDCYGIVYESLLYSYGVFAEYTEVSKQFAVWSYQVQAANTWHKMNE